MTKLSALHRELNRLGRWRRRLWFGTGASALLLALLWMAVVLFLADWLLDMTRTQRIVALIASLLTLGWAYRRYTRPWLRRRESELEVAMLVERQSHIDSDLVAAIQFEQPEAGRWGSAQLEKAVIDHVASVGSRIDLGDPVVRVPFRRRSLVLAATAAMLVLAVAFYPDYAMVFLRRLALGSMRYPTQTVIESVSIAGRRVVHDSWPGEPVRVSYGEPIDIEIFCSGRLPEQGIAELTLLDGSQANPINLPGNPSRPGRYLGQLPRMLDSVTCRIRIGDAQTEEGRLLVTLPPLVDIESVVMPPPYTLAATDSPTITTRLHQLSVAEGSRIEIRAVSNKPLQTVFLQIGDDSFSMARRTDDAQSEGDVWFLRPDDTPFETVDSTIRYEIRATDVDDLTPQGPLAGTIRIKADQLPTIESSAVTRHVLPTATPTLWYAASDDYGLNRIELMPEVVRADGTNEAREPIVIFRLSGQASPPRNQEDRYRFDIAPLGVVAGDRLDVRVRVTDNRGSKLSGKSVDSEPLTFDVTDQRGILAAMSESDRESAERLKTMIGHQVEVGEGQ